ncbi:MAG: hypothetical protein JSV52_11490 [Candidatus Zixiibacteriota bacterium]|nr:MAG: hypothetical protein JSV52_11490 [candidate division Zixibacteria bacterium]
MANCPACNTEIADDASTCYICGCELDEEREITWTIIGEIEDKLSADFGKEALATSEIPAVVFSRSGFFGNIGLPLNPFYKAGSALFEISVPEEFIEEASEILEMTLGKKWHRKES